MDAGSLGLLELHRHRRDDVHDRAHLLPRAQVDVGDAHLLGLVHDLLLHGLPGQVHPPVRGHDLRRVERDALRDGEGRRGGPARGGDLPPRADDLQPDVHQRRHGQVRRGVPAPAALGGDADRPGRRRDLRDPGRVLRRHPDRRLPDAPHRRRRGHHGRHGLRQAGGDDLHPQGPGLVLARADVDICGRGSRRRRRRPTSISGCSGRSWRRASSG